MVDTSLFTNYTWAEIKLGVKHSLMSALAGGVNLTIAGRSIMRVSVKEAMAIYEWADANEQIESAGDNGGGIALVRYGERV